ncbi:MAG: VTC domain-containing protein, partial [Peptococcaceae bacterium]|nr:VTC domain-containing protein [Peptococcaceae bacterium]
MTHQTVFQRYEKKYIIDQRQYESLLRGCLGKLIPAQHSAYTVANLYYDTEDFELIRAALAKPVYREKLRLRCYGAASEDEPVFLELKKKYRGVVYKRRVRLPY